MSQQGPHCSPHCTAKTNDKAQISGKLFGISDVVIASVYFEKTRLKKIIMIINIIIMNKSRLLAGARN